MDEWRSEGDLVAVQGAALADVATPRAALLPTLSGACVPAPRARARCLLRWSAGCCALPERRARSPCCGGWSLRGPARPAFARLLERAVCSFVCLPFTAACCEQMLLDDPGSCLVCEAHTNMRWEEESLLRAAAQVAGRAGDQAEAEALQ